MRTLLGFVIKFVLSLCCVFSCNDINRVDDCAVAVVVCVVVVYVVDGVCDVVVYARCCSCWC